MYRQAGSAPWGTLCARIAASSARISGASTDHTQATPVCCCRRFRRGNANALGAQLSQLARCHCYEGCSSGEAWSGCGLPMPGRGEAPRPDRQEVEAVTATAEPKSPAFTEHLMEAICAPDNIEAALRAVVRNKGAPGIDGITVKQLPGILKARWSEIEDQL